MKMQYSFIHIIRIVLSFTGLVSNIQKLTTVIQMLVEAKTETVCVKN